MTKEPARGELLEPLPALPPIMKQDLVPDANGHVAILIRRMLSGIRSRPTACAENPRGDRVAHPDAAPERQSWRGRRGLARGRPWPTRSGLVWIAPTGRVPGTRLRPRVGPAFPPSGLESSPPSLASGPPHLPHSARSGWLTRCSWMNHFAPQLWHRNRRSTAKRESPASRSLASVANRRSGPCGPAGRPRAAPAD
jgi:hypothetical protein